MNQIQITSLNTADQSNLNDNSLLIKYVSINLLSLAEIILAQYLFCCPIIPSIKR